MLTYRFPCFIFSHCRCILNFNRSNQPSHHHYYHLHRRICKDSVLVSLQQVFLHECSVSSPYQQAVRTLSLLIYRPLSAMLYSFRIATRMVLSLILVLRFSSTMTASLAQLATQHRDWLGFLHFCFLHRVHLFFSLLADHQPIGEGTSTTWSICPWSKWSGVISLHAIQAMLWLLYVLSLRRLVPTTSNPRLSPHQSHQLW